MFFSSQQKRVKVGAVNGNVAPHTLSAGLETQSAVWHCGLAAKSRMALQTQFAPFPPDKHHAVDASMRIVTGDAAFNFSGRMLVNKRAMLLHMALRTCF